MDHRFQNAVPVSSKPGNADHPLHDTASAAAVIMAGGRSSRMGSDKPLLKIGSETMLERAVRFWRSSGRVSRIFIANGPEGHLEPLPAGTTGIPDRLDSRGPMAGLCAVFESTDVDLLYVSAVDMPYLRREAILPPPPADAAVYRCGGRLQPLFGVYRRSILPKARQMLDEGKGQMRELLMMSDTLVIDLPDEEIDMFSNINTPEDLQRVRAGFPPMAAVCGWHDSGKTTFISRLIPLLKARGLKVGVIKHNSDGFDMDRPGTDTFIAAGAGADPVAIIGPDSYAVLGTGVDSPEQLRPLYSDCDLILAEGFKTSGLPKIEYRRAAQGLPRIVTDDTLIALVTDDPSDEASVIVPHDDYERCADLICRIFFA